MTGEEIEQRLSSKKRMLIGSASLVCLSGEARMFFPCNSYFVPHGGVVNKRHGGKG